MKWFISVLFLFFFSLTGCTYLKDMLGLNLERPNIRLEKLDVKKADLSALELEAQLLVENPNSFSLDVQSLSYEAKVANDSLLSGIKSDPFSIPAKASLSVKLPLKVEMGKAFKLLKQMFEKGERELVVDLAGEGVFSTKLGEIKVPYSQQKVIKL